MSNRKKLSEVQYYAANAAHEKMIKVNQEMQSLLKEIASEIGIDFNNEKWGLSGDMKYFERQDVPSKDKK